MKDEIVIDGVKYRKVNEEDESKDWRDAVIEKYSYRNALKKVNGKMDNNPCIAFKEESEISMGDPKFWAKVFRAGGCLWKTKGEGIRIGIRSYPNCSYSQMLEMLK